MQDAQNLHLGFGDAVDDDIGPYGRNFARTLAHAGTPAVRKRRELVGRYDKAPTDAIDGSRIPFGEISQNRGQVLYGVVRKNDDPLGADNSPGLPHDKSHSRTFS